MCGKAECRCCIGKKPKPGGGAGTGATPSPTGSISEPRKANPRLNPCEYLPPWTDYRGSSRKTSSGPNAQISLGLWGH